jgi:DNA polymerase III sliding clamp (beta) subunit (PCNA family)
MRGAVMKEALASALTVVGKGITRKQWNPASGMVSLEFHEHGLRLRAMDWSRNINMTVEVPAKVEKKGTICVSHDRLSALVSMLSNERIDFELCGDRLQLKCGAQKANFTTMPGDTIPSPMSTEPAFMILGDDFKNAVASARLCLLPEGDPRSLLTGANLIWNQDALHIYAADGYTLATAHITGVGMIEPFNIILPPGALNLIDVMDAPIQMFLGEGTATLKSADVELQFPLLKGKFPDVQTILNGKFPKRMTFFRVSVAQALKTVSPFGNSFHLRCEGEDVWVHGKDKTSGDVEVKLYSTDSQDNLGFIILSKTLLSIVLKEKWDKLVIEWKDHRSPARITSGDEGGSVFVMMPLTSIKDSEGEKVK